MREMSARLADDGLRHTATKRRIRDYLARGGSWPARAGGRRAAAGRHSVRPGACPSG